MLKLTIIFFIIVVVPGVLSDRCNFYTGADCTDPVTEAQYREEYQKDVERSKEKFGEAISQMADSFTKWMIENAQASLVFSYKDTSFSFDALSIGLGVTVCTPKITGMIAGGKKWLDTGIKNVNFKEKPKISFCVSHFNGHVKDNYPGVSFSTKSVGLPIKAIEMSLNGFYVQSSNIDVDSFRKEYSSVTKGVSACFSKAGLESKEAVGNLLQLAFGGIETIVNGPKCESILLGSWDVIGNCIIDFAKCKIDLTQAGKSILLSPFNALKAEIQEIKKIISGASNDLGITRFISDRFKM